MTDRADTDEQLLIGEFAQRCRLPVSTLRYYDRIGLLHPAVVDESSGYRRYHADQLASAELIARLRMLGVAPQQIAEIL
ncbi:MAG TPA: MerR family transcriptional regulator, partial [Sporichthya sp.]|nr:MerR family transcriptional regulator [Sporichthya sp.]